MVRRETYNIVGVLQMRGGMGILQLPMLGRTVSVNADAVAALYACVASALGFDSSGTMAVLQGDSTANLTGALCSCNGGVNGTQCTNISCLFNPVSNVKGKRLRVVHWAFSSCVGQIHVAVVFVLVCGLGPLGHGYC